uniref:BLVR domain-containing protein n=1 Tax=Elaeophora elaphi TaxID=1147741 RepID=A0A0R3S4T2_9BILA
MLLLSTVIVDHLLLYRFIEFDELQSDEKKKADNGDNVSSNQTREGIRDSNGARQFPDPDDKEVLFYPPVTEPTPSTKRKREEELEKDKEEKIREGFYQSRSDEDDTLEPIKSLKDEETDPADKSNVSRKVKRKKSASQRGSVKKLKKNENSKKENKEQRKAEN